MKNNYFTYVLRSQTDHKFYVGFTKDLENRLDQHSGGKVQSTKIRRPLNLIYYEVCFNKEDAIHREQYLKSSYGK